MGISVLAAYHVLKKCLDFITVKHLDIHIWNLMFPGWGKRFLGQLETQRGPQSTAGAAAIYGHAYNLHTNISTHAHPTLLSPVNPAAWVRILGFRFYLVHPGNWNVSIKFCSRDAATWVARNPAFHLLIWHWVTTNFWLHKTIATCFLMHPQNNQSLRSTSGKCLPCLWITQVTQSGSIHHGILSWECHHI